MLKQVEVTKEVSNHLVITRVQCPYCRKVMVIGYNIELPHAREWYNCPLCENGFFLVRSAHP